MHNMNWDDLRYFLAVHRAGSTNGAARHLNVEHTTVGRRLTALEEAVGARLFLRTKQGAKPTAAAARILAFAEAAERSALAIERVAGASDRRIAGVVRLTTSEAFGGYLIGKLSRLHDRHPDLKIDLHTGNVVLDLMRGEADVAVRFAATPQPDLVRRRIGEMPWALYASSDYLARRPLGAALDGLSGHDLIGLEKGLAQSPGAQWIGEYGGAANIPLVANSLVAALDAAAAGMGLAVAPRFLAADKPLLRCVSTEGFGAHAVWVVFRRDVGRLARVRAVVDFVVGLVAADRDRLSGRT
jgi:DNA-binding transcriptional LysR family regulator